MIARAFAIAVVAVTLSGGRARAEMIALPDPPTSASDDTDDDAMPSMLGFRFGGGTAELPHGPVFEMGLGIGVEHHLFGRWRLGGEYEYLFLSDDTELMAGNERAQTSVGRGHRAHVLLRRRMLESRWIQGRIRFFADAELGGGMLLASVPSETIVAPHAFVGVRAGYDISSLGDSRGSRIWESEILVRAIANRRDGTVGWMFGIGMNWGD